MPIIGTERLERVDEVIDGLNLNCMTKNGSIFLLLHKDSTFHKIVTSHGSQRTANFSTIKRDY